MNYHLAKMTAARVLLKDFGYDVRRNKIVSLAIRGFCGESIVGPCSDEFDAINQLRSIVRDDEFTTRATDFD